MSFNRERIGFYQEKAIYCRPQQRLTIGQLWLEINKNMWMILYYNFILFIYFLPQITSNRESYLFLDKSTSKNKIIYRVTNVNARTAALLLYNRQPEANKGKQNFLPRPKIGAYLRLFSLTVVRIPQMAFTGLRGQFNEQNLSDQDFCFN